MEADSSNSWDRMSMNTTNFVKLIHPNNSAVLYMSYLDIKIMLLNLNLNSTRVKLTQQSHEFAYLLEDSTST